MKCPQCKKTVKPRAARCPHCKTRLVRRSDKVVRGFTVRGPAAIACGGILAFVGSVLLIYSQYLFGGVVLAMGLLFLWLGRRV